MLDIAQFGSLQVLEASVPLITSDPFQQKSVTNHVCSGLEDHASIPGTHACIRARRCNTCLPPFDWCIDWLHIQTAVCETAQRTQPSIFNVLVHSAAQSLQPPAILIRPRLQHCLIRAQRMWSRGRSCSTCQRGSTLGTWTTIRTRNAFLDTA
jgi:hypothetical protein